MARTFLICILICACVSAQAQKLSRPEKKIFMKAEEACAIGDYFNAYTLYNQVYAADSMNAYLNHKIGVCMFNLKKFRTDSYRYFKKAENGKFRDTYFYLGLLEHQRLEFNEAIKNFNQYKHSTGTGTFTLKETDRQINISEFARNMIKHPVNIEIENLGEKVNSKFPDYVPLISADEKMLVFTSRREGSSDNKLDPFGDYFEDVFISYNVNGKWTAPASIGQAINTPTHDACVALSADGQQLITYKTSDDMMSGDLYLSDYNGKEWTKPIKLPEVINSGEYIEASAALAADNDLIYFSSDRPGGFGGKDLYFSRRLPDNSWGLPMNLGPVVNTEYDEDAPFIHPDGKTLYFSSKGHRNMGGYDIFKAVKEETGEWALPENLGHPINSVDDDVYFVLSIDGKNGYYSANKPNGYGDQDIYLIRNPEQLFQLNIIKGKAIDQNTKEPVQAKITLLNKISDKVEGIFRTNRLNGTFVIIGYPGLTYDLIIEAVDYQTVIKGIQFPGADFLVPLKRKEE